MTKAEEAYPADRTSAAKGSVVADGAAGADTDGVGKTIDVAEAQRLIDEAVCREPLQRELKFAILAYCRQRHELADVEAYVATLPQFRHAAQNQYHMIVVLERAGGLRRIDFDADGVQVTPERVEGLSADESEDLVVQTFFETTEAGSAFVEAHAPTVRFTRLLTAEPDRADAFLDVLQFCSEKPRSYGELTKLFSGNKTLLSPVGNTGQRIQPSVFLDRLERCGFIEWDNGWRTGKEGVAYINKQAR